MHTSVVCVFSIGSKMVKWQVSFTDSRMSTLWTKLCPLKIHLMKTYRLHKCDLSGDKSFKELIKVKWGHNAEAIIWKDLCSYKRKKHPETSISLHLQDKGPCGDIMRRRHLQDREKPPRNQTCYITPWSWSSTLQNCKKYMFKAPAD